jgi:hypothetical protein
MSRLTVFWFDGSGAISGLAVWRGIRRFRRS